MNTIRSLIVFGLLAVSQAEAAEGRAVAENREDQNRPNIVLLMGDDHGWDETGYNGHPHLKTPILDKMAASGLRFDWFYAAHPTCSPTRGSVMTGRHPNRYGTFTPNYSIRPQEVTIAQLLKDAGYACGHFGKWHLGPVKASSPTNPGTMGFDRWLSHDNFFELNPVLSRNGQTPERVDGESSEIIVQEAIEFAAAANRQHQPFFAVIWFGSPHEPYSGLKKDLDLYRNLPEEWSNQTFRLTSNETGRPTTRPLRNILQERYAEITAMDRSIGQLRSWLQDRQIKDNTLLWYCGDNGTPGDGIVTSPFRGKKGTVYEGGIRVPGIIEWPSRISSATVSTMNAVTSDILPTLCAITQIELPQRPLDGIDLTPVFDGKMDERPSPIGFWMFDTKQDKQNTPLLTSEDQRGTTPLVKLMGNIPTRNFINFRHPRIMESDYRGNRVLLGNRFKLVIHDQGKTNTVELFDIRNDPEEQTNVASEHTDIVQEMTSNLKAWQTSVLQSLTGADD